MTLLVARILYSMYGLIWSSVHRSRALNNIFKRSSKFVLKLLSIKARTYGVLDALRSIIPMPRKYSS